MLTIGLPCGVVGMGESAGGKGSAPYPLYNGTFVSNA